MAKVIKPILLGSLLFCIQNASASNQPTTFLGPTLKARYTNVYNENGAYTILGEAGVKNYRINGTLAWQFWLAHKIKLSLEFLTQDINYHFFSGNSTQWLTQGAIGGVYQYAFLGYTLDPTFDFSTYYAHSPNKTLTPRSGNFFSPSLGFPVFFTNYRRIAGSHDGSASAGFTVTPWLEGRLGLDLNYDNINYNKKSPPTQNQRGFGGTIHLKQALTPNIDVGALAGVRNPFNLYQANIAFKHIEWYGDWTLGLDGAYVVGKNTLPNTYNVSLDIAYLLDLRCHPYEENREAAKRFIDYKNESFRPLKPDHFVEWVKEPAVYVPQVLAVPDEYSTQLVPL